MQRAIYQGAQGIAVLEPAEIDRIMLLGPGGPAAELEPIMGHYRVIWTAVSCLQGRDVISRQALQAACQHLVA